MNNPRAKRTPEKDLAWAIIGCCACALPMFGLSAWAFANKAGFAINRETVSISDYNTVLKWALFMTIELPFFLGVAFLGFGYMVWNAKRKFRGLMRQNIS